MLFEGYMMILLNNQMNYRFYGDVLHNIGCTTMTLFFFILFRFFFNNKMNEKIIKSIGL